MSSGEQNLAVHTTAEAKVEANDPLVGTTIAERYLIEAHSGMGAWSSVYQAKDLSLQRVVAIKVLHAYLASQDEKIERFRKEALAASSLLHPNITTVFDYGFLAKGQPFIVMEYLDGITLSDELREGGPTDLPRFLSLTEQLCSALAAAHANGLLHRDIKPSNIMLVRSEGSSARIAKLVDFGLAKSFIEQSGDMTATGETMGTPAYMSPEQCRGSQLDTRSDIYSLGCVLYEMLTGVKAFHADVPWECMHRHLNEPPKRFREVAPKAHIPPVIESIILKTLQKNPKDRFNSIAELQRALSLYSAKLLTKKSFLSDLQLRRAAGLPYINISQSNGKIAIAATLLLACAAASVLITHNVNSAAKRNAVVAANGTRTFAGRDGNIWQIAPPEIIEFPATSIGEIWSVNEAGQLSNFMGKAQGKVEIPVGRRFAVAVSNAGLQHMDWFKTIKNPWLSALSFVGDSVDLKMLSNLRDLPGLTALHFKHVPITDDQVSEFKNVPRVTALALNGAHITNRGMVALSDELPNLKWLSLRNDQFSVPSLSTLKLFPQLTSLDLFAMRDLSDDDMAQIGQLKHLTALNLARTNVSAKGMAKIANLSQLQVLSLARADLTDEGIKQLEGLQNLVSLSLRTNEEITDASVAPLSKLKSLRWLELSRTAITPDGVDKLSKLLPNCHISRQWEPN